MKICQLPSTKLSYRDFSARDVRHLLADMSKAQTLLDYDPITKVRAGVAAIMPLYVSKVAIK
jgi:UDP-N-acetylglucosamine/UDP-N-acetylgalactosamine 4-epimerase